MKEKKKKTGRKRKGKLYYKLGNIRYFNSITTTYSHLLSNGDIFPNSFQILWEELLKNFNTNHFYLVLVIIYHKIFVFIIDWLYKKNNKNNDLKRVSDLTVLSTVT